VEGGALLRSVGESPGIDRDWIIIAAGPEEIAALLEAAWGDWLDFYFPPSPKRFQLFADHDEYTTVFGATKGHVSIAAAAARCVRRTDG
jgi:hypothetical protein